MQQTDKLSDAAIDAGRLLQGFKQLQSFLNTKQQQQQAFL
jgi:Sec-independent protein translocase protein TatA